MRNDAVIVGHDVLAVERFKDDTRHMVVLDVLDHRSTIGNKGERLRLFLSDDDYSEVLAVQRRGYIRIRKHFDVIEGHILPARKKKRRH